MNKSCLLLVVLAGGALAVGCGPSGNNANTSGPTNAVYDYPYDKRDVYLADASNDLAALNRKINELADQAATVGETIRTNAQPKIQKLRDERATLGRKLEALKTATQADWNAAKSDYMKAFNEASTSCQQAWEWLTGNQTNASKPLQP